MVGKKPESKILKKDQLNNQMMKSGKVDMLSDDRDYLDTRGNEIISETEITESRKYFHNGPNGIGGPLNHISN